MRTNVSLAGPCTVAFWAVLGFCIVSTLLVVGVSGVYAQEVSESEAIGAGTNQVPVAADAASEEKAPEALQEGAKMQVPGQNYSVSPIVANETTKPRDILKKELLVTNHTQHKLDLYISVHNVDPTEGGQEFVSPGVADLSHSLANWIEITRGVIELAPGESRKIPYLIHVNVTAEPGSYFARIVFSEGSRRSTATGGGGEDGTSLLLNVAVQDDAKERLQLGTFKSDDSVVMSDSVSFSYQLENIGNRTIEPRGAIRIFNRRGEEVGSVPLNPEGVEITPENNEQLAAAWSASGRFGKYKAYLDLEYGENQLASVQDTVYFWVFPWKEIFASVLGVLVLAIIGTYVIHMRTVARPAPQHAGQTPAYATQSHAAYAPAEMVQMPSSRHREPPQQSYDTGGATVLPSRRTVVRRAPAEAQETPSVVAAPPRAASTNRPQVHGNVVQLSPRR
jgi:hypothetical protein